jgi:UDP-N-acetylmuramoylalanine--D-glutamate ligase
MGLGQHGGGLGAAKFLAANGARLTISDTATAEVLADPLSELRGCSDIALHLGGHEPADFSTADFVVVNPAVRPKHPCLETARAAGARITSEIELFLKHCPGRVIGVTGSNGKSTTCTMLLEILKRAGRRAWIGGNIGGSLLGDLDRMTPCDWVVLELSSFQLMHLSSDARLPEIAVVTNCSPNHLDWHGCYEDYAAAKQRLLGAKRVVMNSHAPELAQWSLPEAQVLPEFAFDKLPALRVPGIHNQQNAACAAAAARAAGVDEPAISAALADFVGLEHRVEWIAQVCGRHFYNDSKSTSPAATMAAIDAMERPTWLLLGGVSKGTEFEDLAVHAASRVGGVAIYGEARSVLRNAFHSVVEPTRIADFETLQDALQWCYTNSRPGETILLSPACASFDQYSDFAARGRHFRELIGAIVAS